MILAITYKEVFSAVAPSHSRSYWPETTEELEVRWVAPSIDSSILTYEYIDGTRDYDFMSDIKSYSTRAI